MTVKRITHINMLLAWLAEKVLSAEPRGHIPNGFVELFQEFVDDLSTERFSRALLLGNVLGIMARNQGTTHTHYDLPAFLIKFDRYACFGPSDDAFNYDAVSVFIEEADEHLKLGLKMKWKDDDTFIVKSRDPLLKFERVWVNVVYRVHDDALI